MNKRRKKANEFGKYIFELRMNKGVSLTEAGKHIGISANYLGELERGVGKKVSDEVVRNIAIYYEIPEEILFYKLGRVPLGVKEEVEESPQLLDLLSEIAKNKNIDKDKKETIYRKIKEYYDKLLDDI